VSDKVAITKTQAIELLRMAIKNNNAESGVVVVEQWMDAATRRVEELEGVIPSPMLRRVDNECTSYPYWLIVKNGGGGRHVLLAGVWFDRDSAEAELESRRYHYGEKAFVFCFSGNASEHMQKLYSAAALAAKGVK
jgi:hypothetical protein